MKHQGGIEAQDLKVCEPLRQRFHQRRRLGRAQHLEGMRIERDHAGEGARCLRPLDYAAKNFLVAKMHAIEITHGKHGAANITRNCGGVRAEFAHPLLGRVQHGELRSCVHLEAQAVIGQLHVGKTFSHETLVGLLVGQVVGDVCEPGAARSELGYQRERLSDSLVHGVRSVAQSAKYQIVRAKKKGLRFFGYPAEIGKVGEAAHAIAKNRHVAMLGRNRRPGYAEQFKRSFDDVRGNQRDRAERGLAVENIGKCPPQDCQRLLGSKNGHGHALAHVKRANVVESQNVIGMSMRKDDGVKLVKLDAQALKAKIRRGVDNHVMPVAGEQD